MRASKRVLRERLVEAHAREARLQAELAGVEVDAADWRRRAAERGVEVGLLRGRLAEVGEYRAAAEERLADEKALVSQLCGLVGRWRARFDEQVAMTVEAVRDADFLSGANERLAERVVSAEERADEATKALLRAQRSVTRLEEARDLARADRDHWFARAMAAEDRLEAGLSECDGAIPEGHCEVTVVFVGDAESVADAEAISAIWDFGGENTCTGGELFEDICKLFGGSD